MRASTASLWGFESGPVWRGRPGRTGNEQENSSEGNLSGPSDSPPLARLSKNMRDVSVDENENGGAKPYLVISIPGDRLVV